MALAGHHVPEHHSRKDGESAELPPLASSVAPPSTFLPAQRLQAIWVPGATAQQTAPLAQNSAPSNASHSPALPEALRHSAPDRYLWPRNPPQELPKIGNYPTPQISVAAGPEHPGLRKMPYEVWLYCPQPDIAQRREMALVELYLRKSMRQLGSP